LRCEKIVKEGSRKRYIGFHITNNSDKVEKKDIVHIVRKNCKNLFDKDVKDLGIYVIKFNGTYGIVRCKHTEKENTIKLLTNIKNVASEKVEIKTLGTSGTIKSLMKKHMKNITF
jgi:RNase P/RNase MRP subunit POP5